MTLERLVALLEREGLSPEGDGPQFVFYAGRVRVIASIDVPNDRMRFMVPVGKAADAEALELLKANYIATQDLRFAVNRGVVWLAFLHPLSSLTERDALSAVNQLAHHAERLTSADPPPAGDAAEPEGM